MIIESIQFKFDDENSLLKHKSSFEEVKYRKTPATIFYIDSIIPRFAENGTCLQIANVLIEKFSILLLLQTFKHHQEKKTSFHPIKNRGKKFLFFKNKRYN